MPEINVAHTMGVNAVPSSEVARTLDVHAVPALQPQRELSTRCVIVVTERCPRSCVVLHVRSGALRICTSAMLNLEAGARCRWHRCCGLWWLVVVKNLDGDYGDGGSLEVLEAIGFVHFIRARIAPAVGLRFFPVFRIRCRSPKSFC